MSSSSQLLRDFESKDSGEAKTADCVGPVRLRRKNLMHMARGDALESRYFAQRRKVLRHKSHNEKRLIVSYQLGQADAQVMYPENAVSSPFQVKCEYTRGSSE